jgi:hypothetical protein
MPTTLRVTQSARASEAMAIRGNNPINGMQERPRAGESAEKPKRPGPPDLAGNFRHRVGPAEISAVCQRQAHLAKQGLVAHAKPLASFG